MYLFASVDLHCQLNKYGKSDNLEVRHLSPTKKDVHSKIATTENTMNILNVEKNNRLFSAQLAQIDEIV